MKNVLYIIVVTLLINNVLIAGSKKNMDIDILTIIPVGKYSNSHRLGWENSRNKNFSDFREKTIGRKRFKPL